MWAGITLKREGRLDALREEQGWACLSGAWQGSGITYQSPAAFPRPLPSRAGFWPAAAEANVDGRLDGIFC